MRHRATLRRRTFLGGVLGAIGALCGGSVSATWLKTSRSSPTIADLGWLGGNVDQLASYYANVIYSDAVKNSRNFFDFTTGAVLTTAGGGLDSAGWPIVDFQLGLSANGGNCPDGTYTGTVTGDTALPTVTANAGCTVSQTGSSGNTRTFTVTVSGSGNTSIKVAGGNGYSAGIHVYRPGLDANSPVHNPAAIAYFQTYSGIRFMKPQNTESNSAQTNWTGTIASGGRVTPANRKCGFGGEDSSPTMCMAWEDLVDFSNALYAAPSSQFKWAHVHFHGTLGDSYLTSALTLLRDRKTGAWYYRGGKDNERWNSVYTGPYALDRENARVATDTLWNDGTTTNIASASGSGTTITVNTVADLPGTWVSGRHIDAFLVSAYRDVTITVTGARQFTFPGVTTAGALSVAATCLFIGDINNGLNFDHQLSSQILGNRYHAKRTREIALLAEAVFGSLGGDFRMVLEDQQQSATFSGSLNVMLEYLETQFTDRAVNTYIDSIAIAPYAQPSNVANDVDTIIAAFTSDASNGINAILLKAEKAMAVAAVYGVKASCYEGGLSTLVQSTPTQATIIAVYADARVRTLSKTLYQGLWARGFREIAHMEITPLPTNQIPTGANKKYFFSATGISDPLTQRQLAFQDMLATAQGSPNIATHTLPGTLEGNSPSRLQYSGFSGPGFTWSNNAGLHSYGADFNAATAAEKAKSHSIWYGVLCTQTGDYTIELPVYLTTAGLTGDQFTVSVDGGTPVNYPISTGTVTPLVFRAPVAIGSFVAGRFYSIKLTLKAGMTSNISIGGPRFAVV